MSLTLLQKVDLASSSSEINFSAGPGFSDLMLFMNLRSSESTSQEDGIAIRLNGIATGFTSIDVTTTQAPPSTLNANVRTPIVTNVQVGGKCPSASTPTGTYGISKVIIPSYSESGWLKCVMTEYSYYVFSSATTRMGRVGTTWNSTVPINSITIYPADGSAWEAGSVATLYGLKAA